MHTYSRSALLAATTLLVVAALAPNEAEAQTPAQMEYDRQQREYRQQQEQQRQEQQRQQQLMNENARRQQEQSRQLNAPAGQSPTPGQGATPPTGSGQTGGQALEEARQSWLKRPPLPPDRNPLLGRWKRPPTGQANSSDPFAALQALAKGGLCEVLFGGGTFEFRAATLVGFDARTGEQELDKVEYRGGAKQVVVLPKTTFRIIVFDFDGPDRINWSGQNCVLVRVGPASHDAALASSTQARPAAAPAAESSRKGGAAPAASGTATTASAAGGGTGTVAARATMLSLVAGLLYPSGKYFPMAGTTFYVMKENLDTALARGGVQTPPGGSPLRAWITACEAQQAAVCAQGNRVFEATTVATLRTNLQGQAELGTLNAGTYYVYGGNQRYQQRNVLWNVRVDVREGANNSVKLDQANVTAVN
jgi:sRNA-binding protein